ncbi:MAG: FHA domain-containing protein, partial [Bacteroidota bacterium]
METNKISARRSFSNTIGAGFKSLSGKGKTFYVLEFKNNTQLHKASTSKQIIVDYVEIGRNPKCQVRFGEDCRTVSGIHCAIVRDGNNYYVKHLSKTNPTLINDKPVADKWYLTSGDELTLSYGGPVIGFIVPANNYTSSIPLTRRLNLFREQALRPYKTAIAVLALILFLCIGVFGYKYNILDNLYKKQSDEIVATKLKIENLKAATQAEIDTLNKRLAKKEKLISDLKIKFSQIPISTSKVAEGSFLPSPSDINQLYPSVFYVSPIKIVLQYNGETYETQGGFGTGTGFLLNDGRFVTARHVIAPWFFYDSNDPEALISANKFVSIGGKITATYKAESSDGTTFQFNSDNFHFDDKYDNKYKGTSEDGDEYLITKAPYYSDWAVAPTSSSGALIINNQLSNNLSVGTNLCTLGFPFGLGVNENGVEPMYSTFEVSQGGTNKTGFINISGRSFDPGNSGGPVFIKSKGGYDVVGIVSAGKGSQGILI